MSFRLNFLDLGTLRTVGLALSIGVSSIASAATVELSADMPMQRVTAYQLLEDASGFMTAGAVYSGDYDAEFTSANSDKSSLGITSSAWWIRFAVQNSTELPLEYVLHYPFPMVDLVDVYQVADDGQLMASYLLGEKRPQSVEVISSEGYSAKLQIEPASTNLVYLRITNPLGDILDSYFEIGAPTDYQRTQDHINLVLGFILGGGLIILLYNAVLWGVLRDQIYGWYVAYLSAALLTFVVVSGLWHQFIWMPESLLSEVLPPIASSMTCLLLVQFSRHFLLTQQTVPRIDRLLRIWMGLLLAPIVLFILGYSSLAAQTALLSSISLNLMPILGLYLWRKGNRVALIYACAWLVWVVAIGGLAARALGWLPTNDWTLRLGWLGIWGEAVIFAMALGARIRILQEDKADAEARERASLERSNAELEALVHERTRDLEIKRDELQVLNSEKDKFFSIIAHDLRNPFQGVYGLSELLSENLDSFSQNELQDTLDDLHKGAVQLHRLLENLLAWAQLQKGSIRLAPEALSVYALLMDCISIFESSAKQKQLQIECAADEGLRVWADEPALETIIRNLLSNAIKFSNTGGQIKIRAQAVGSQIEMTVQDEGVGMDADKLSKLLTLGEQSSVPGTQGESGSGLGLQLCKELIHLHGGKLNIESQPGQGSCFRVTLSSVVNVS